MQASTNNVNNMISSISSSDYHRSSQLKIIAFQETLGKHCHSLCGRTFVLLCRAHSLLLSSLKAAITRIRASSTDRFVGLWYGRWPCFDVSLSPAFGFVLESLSAMRPTHATNEQALQFTIACPFIVQTPNPMVLSVACFSAFYVCKIGKGRNRRS